jgi:membrane fusion protein (multidrug efflux system)
MSAYEEDGAAALQGTVGTGRTTAPRASLGQRLRLPLLLAAPILIVAAALFVYLTGGRYVSTDDAYVQSARGSVSANVSGQVVEVDVRENQFVHAGDVLFRLDSRPYDVAVEQAQAELISAQEAISATQASLGQTGDEVTAAQDTLNYDQKELARQKAMAASGVSSQQQLDAAQHAVDSAKADLAAAMQHRANVLATLGGAADGPIAAYANVKRAQAALDRAKLNQSYATVRALQDGVVTKVEQLQVGDYVNAAQPLFDLVAPRLWVEANFKENQLSYMRPGQAATVKIDAYPGRTYRLHVASLSPGTGNSFSVLPAENATGNWVKVVQRLPVRLVFDSDVSAIRVPLAAGLSATVTVDTDHRRTLFGYGVNHHAVDPR